MRIDLFRSFAALLGMSVASVACADFGQTTTGVYVPPSKWSNFNVPPVPSQSFSGETIAPTMHTDQLTAVRPLAPQPKYSTPTPADSFGSQPLFGDSTSVRPAGGVGLQGTVAQTSTGHPTPTPMYQDGYTPISPSHVETPHPEPSPMMHSPFAEAVSAPWSDCDPAPSCVTSCAPARLPLAPWFGGGNVLLWNMVDNGYHRFLFDDAMPSTTRASTDDIAPNFGVGYDLFVGRYFGCGRYALSVNYLNFDPSSEEISLMPAVAGGYRAAMPQYQGIEVDHDMDPLTPAESVYDLYDAADSFTVRRDVSIQGLELNLSCFGIGGARRLAPLCGSGHGCGPLAKLRNCFGLCRPGCTGAGGALESPCGGCSQLVMSHGFRWLQFNDEFRFASFDAAYAGDPVNMMHDIDAENNLYGYQFGGRITYCLTPRLVANIGTKGGIYGNDVSVDQRIGTGMEDAYVNAMPGRIVNTRSNDVVLSGLGELDLGLGYRLTNCWTLNGGYRALYATGVATSVGSIANDYATIANSPRVYADDSLLLHGAYVGASMNW